MFSSHLFWASSSLDVPAGVTQDFSAVRAFIFLARSVQPFFATYNNIVTLLGVFGISPYCIRQRVDALILRYVCVCVWCVVSSHLFWTLSSLDVPAGVTQDFSSRCSFCGACLYFYRARIQPFLSLADREVKFCVLTIQSFSTCWEFFIFTQYFYFLVRKNPSYRDSNPPPNVSEGYEVSN